MSAPAFLSMKIGSVVTSDGSRFQITHLLGIDSVLAKNLETNAIEQLRVDLLQPYEVGDEHSVSVGQDLEDICDEDWKEAQRRFSMIKPLIEDRLRTREKVRAAAAIGGMSTGTLYEWIRAYNEAGQLSALIPLKRGRRTGQKGLDAAQEKIIDAAIKEVFLAKQRRRPQDVVDHVAYLCRNAGVTAPHANTVRNRIKELRPAKVLRARGMGDAARNLFSPIRGAFPGADFPLSVVQIDHTEADVILVEETTRLPMGRPTITLAIDVYSRMVVGCYVSMEKPSAVAAGMCLTNGMTPKNAYLADLEVPGDWPVWGKFCAIHCDNAKEFRGAMLAKACSQYGIDLQMRPVKVPHYGGHIERLMGTSAGEIRKLPGATFSSPKERKGYDSEKEAALTLREFEQRLVDFIVNVYHQRLHSELNLPPRRQWELGVLGDSRQPGRGIPEVPSDPQKLRLDFLPFVERTVQPYGIVIDDIFYYHEVLSPWINARDVDRPKEKRKFIVRRDPRDISVVYFYDPEARQYYEIPYRNTTHPAISVWELQNAQQRLKEEGRAHVDEDAIFDAIGRMRERVESSVAKTKAARRQMHRIKTTIKSAKERAQPVSVTKEADAEVTPTSRPHVALSEDIFSQPIRPFDDLPVKL